MLLDGIICYIYGQITEITYFCIKLQYFTIVNPMHIEEDILSALQFEVDTAKTPLEKVRALNNQLSKLRNDISFGDAMPLLKEALELTETMHESQETCYQRARTLSLQAIVMRNHGEYEAALSSAKDALRYYEELGDIEQQAHLHNSIGNTLGNIGDNIESLHSFYRALELHEVIGNIRGIQMSLGNIGTLFASLGDVERGLEYFERALAIALETGNTEDSGSHLCNIGNVYRKIGDYPRALEYFHRALRIFEEIGDRRRIAALYGNIGTVSFYCGDFDEALSCLKNALQVAEELEDSYGIALWRTNIGELYSTQEWQHFNLEKAEEYLLGALAVQEKAGAMVDQYWIHKILGNVYKLQERWKEAFYHMEKFYHLKDEYHNLSTVKSVTDSDSKRKIEIISKEKEITDAKNAELEIANKLKTKLLGIAAHDLKNPLGNILGFVKMLLEETPPESEHHEMLMMINESSQNMLKLIGDLLESSAAEIGAMTLEQDTIDAAEILRTVIYSNISAAQAKKQKIESKIENIQVIADPKRLRQVMENLISNAIKYSPPSRNITARLIRDGVYARIEVQDEGQGLTQEDMSKLFGQFQRLSAQPTGGETATGLGLSIVKQIVELHGGKIWAESEGKNKGATFIVELPLAE